MQHDRFGMRRAARYLGDAASGIRQAPVEVLATLCTALAFSWALEIDDLAFQSFAETAVACALVLAVAWTGTLLHALGAWDATRRWAVTLGGALVIALYAITVADFQYEAEGWRAALLIAAAVLWLVALPAFGGAGAPSVERMRRVDGRILLRMIGALLYGGALFAGLALALRAIAVLFELDLDDEIYGHVWGWIFFVLVPWIVLGGLADYVRPAEATTQVARVAHRIALYLVPPLLALYGLILYAYVVRIMITGEIPKNLVSPMVLAAGALGALALLVFDPQPRTGLLARWLRLAPALFLPLAPLGAWALLVRIDQYGWTEFRVVRLVVLAAFAALAIGATVQLVRRRPFALHVAPTALAVALLLSAIGPWSALAIGRTSQQHLLEDALARAAVPPDDTTYAAARRPAEGVTAAPRRVGAAAAAAADTARVIDAATYEQVRGSAQYLARHFGPDALPPVLAPLARRDDGRWLDYPAELGLRPDALADGRVAGMGGTLPASVPLRVTGGTAYRIEWTSPERGPRGMPAPEVAGRARAGADVARVTLQDSTVLALHIGERVLRAELAPLLGSLRQHDVPQRDGGQLSPAHAVLPVTDAAGAAAGELIVWQVWAESDSTGLHLRRVEGLVVVR